MSFNIEKLPFGEFEIVRIESRRGGDILAICNYGATVITYGHLLNGKITDILVPYRSPEELVKGEAAVNWIMAPYSNRMRDGEYMIKNQVYLLDEKSGKSHGLVKKLIFNTDKIYSDQEEAVVRYTAEITPGMFSAYPFHIKVSVTYRFRPESLDITIEGINLGSEDIPYGCGWHPYFYFKGKGINSLRLFIPSDEIIRTDKNLVPLITGYVEKLPPESHLYFADSENPKTINSKSVNACYTNLKKNSRGQITTRLINSNNKTVFTIYQQRGVVYAYIPENLRGESRKVIALEPVEFMTDAFNRPELKDKILLAPGQKRAFNFGIITETLH